MAKGDRWLLPDGVEELLPAQAARVEQLRRTILDLYASWGYELVIPSLIEYTESLLIGLGDDLDLHTFKVTDQLSGRLLGIRPDITPQVARIEAHALRREGAVRLCYAGSVLHTRPRNTATSRSPIQIGAELYGEPGLEADIEVICLMLATLRLAGAERLMLDLGHQAIVSTLIDMAGFAEDARQEYFEALQHKAVARIREIVAAQVPDPVCQGWLISLAELHGGPEVFDRARQCLHDAPAAVAEALASLGAIAGRVASRMPGVELHFDLAELHGYHYHTGLVFAAYVPGCGQAVANGGRYDDIGRVFGRARPATGFNTDLKALLGLSKTAVEEARAVYAPLSDDPDWWEAVQRLRSQGRQVICGLTGQDSNDDGRARLVHHQGVWLVEEN